MIENFELTFKDDLINERKIPIQEILYFIVHEKRKTNSIILQNRFNYLTEEFQKILEESLDEDKRKYIAHFKSILNKLDSKSNVDDFLYQIKKIIEEYDQKIYYHSENPIHITDDARILLPDFKNIEIDFSPITKIIYILFCNHSEGINIKELKKHENEILDLFYKTSKALDLNTIKKSIKDLINPESKSIYTHISRVKSTLTDIMGESIAKNYIITSDKFGSEIKYIPILNFKEKFNQLP